MRRTYFIAMFVGFMAIALGSYTAIRMGFVPVAIVNQNFIGSRDFNESVASVEHYYREVAKQSGTPSQSNAAPRAEIERATLDKLIENALIEDELEVRISTDELASLISEKIDALEEVKRPQFKGAVTALYGITAERFQELVLEPKAREEVFVTKINKEEGTYPEVIGNLRKKASVRILVPGLHWENAAVIVRGR